MSNLNNDNIHGNNSPENRNPVLDSGESGTKRINLNGQPGMRSRQTSVQKTEPVEEKKETKETKETKKKPERKKRILSIPDFAVTRTYRLHMPLPTQSAD